jgi:hypothetical protein
MIENLHDQLTAVPKDQRNTPDYLKMQDQLAQAIQDRNAHWKSVDQPNALSKFGKDAWQGLTFQKARSSYSCRASGLRTAYDGLL